mmetsp:Transcript_9434/g.18965  ORF Transcript_9434/g.18965 Transcript_9434/m.18965 type:complete len:80 (+) Transcript_9434:90-329(+)
MNHLLYEQHQEYTFKLHEPVTPYLGVYQSGFPSMLSTYFFFSIPTLIIAWKSGAMPLATALIVCTIANKDVLRLSLFSS